MAWEGGRLSRVHGSLLWSGTLVAIQTQINRGGTLELMIEDGGWRRVGGRADFSRAPLKSERLERITHTWSPSSGGDSHAAAAAVGAAAAAAAASPPKLLRLFPQLVTSVQSSETSQLAAWLHESFMDLELGKLFSGALLELVASIVTVDYWHTAGPLAAIYWG